MKPGAVAALTLVFISLAIPCLSDPAGDLLISGRKAFGDGLYPLAAKSFQRVLDDFPESSGAEEAGYLLGVSLFYAGRFPEAQAALGSFRARHPGSAFLALAGYWLGACDVKLGKYEAALALLAEQAGRTGDSAPFRAHAMLLSGVALEALDRDDEAAAFYRKLLAEKPPAALAPEATFRLAGAEYRAARYDAARDLYGKVLLDGPKSAFVRDSAFFLAESELALGNLAEAEKRYRTVLMLYPDSPYREAATFRLADVSFRQGRGADASAQLDQFARQFPGGAYRGSAERLRADILFDQKKYEEAIATYGKALGILPEGIEKQSALYAMGLAQLALGRKADAAANLGKARVGAARDVGEKAAFQLAVLLAGMGKGDEAIAALGRFLDDFPASASREEALRMIASLLDAKGDAAAAVPRWDALVNGFPRSSALPEHLYRRGAALLAAGRATAALDDFQRAVREFPSSRWRDECNYSIGYIYAQRGEYSRALPFFQAVSPGTASAETLGRSQLSAGMCLFNMGSFDKALARFESLRAARPKGVEEGAVVLSIGRTLYRMERLDEAAQRLKEAAALLTKPAAGPDPDAAEALYWLGWSLFRLGRTAEARDAFLSLAQAHPADPRKPEAFYRAGVCETSRGDDTAAVSLFDRALAAAPGRAAAPAADIREQALYERGWALARIGRRSESADDFEKLAREYPGGTLAPDAFFKAAMQALEAKSYAEARDGFRRVTRDFPKSALAAQSTYWAAEAIRLSGDTKSAADEFWKSILAGPPKANLSPSLEGFRKALLATGDLEGARGFAEKARTARSLPLEASARVQLVYAEMLLDQAPKDALPVITEVRRRSPPEPVAGEASLLLGRYYAAVAEWGRAIDIFSALCGSRADEVGAEAKLGQAKALEASGSTAEAVEEYVRVSYLFPDFPLLAAEGLFNAVRVALRREDREKAARIADSLRKGYPDSAWTAKLAELR